MKLRVIEMSRSVESQNRLACDLLLSGPRQAQGRTRKEKGGISRCFG